MCNICPKEVVELIVIVFKYIVIFSRVHISEEEKWRATKNTL
jgi:hypothetical protein